MNQPVFWSQWADIVEKAENIAHNEQQRQARSGSTPSP